ncbi:hypothetical protein ACFX13_006293 [Malus domestica]
MEELFCEKLLGRGHLELEALLFCELLLSKEDVLLVDELLVKANLEEELDDEVPSCLFFGSFHFSSIMCKFNAQIL